MSLQNQGYDSRIVGENGRRESKKSYAAFVDYCQMGVGRSLAALFKIYLATDYPPTKSFSTLANWSKNFGWVRRAEAFEREQAAQAQAVYEARRQSILETGLAQKHERLCKLYDMFNRLYDDFQVEGNVWMHEAKGIGAADNFTIVDTVRFNAALVSEIRNTLADIAAEVGGRPRKTELTGRNGGPIRSTNVERDLKKLSSEDLERLEGLLEKASPDDDEEPADPGGSAG